MEGKNPALNSGRCITSDKLYSIRPELCLKQKDSPGIRVLTENLELGITLPAPLQPVNAALAIDKAGLTILLLSQQHEETSHSPK